MHLKGSLLASLLACLLQSPACDARTRYDKNAWAQKLNTIQWSGKPRLQWEELTSESFNWEKSYQISPPQTAKGGQIGASFIVNKTIADWKTHFWHDKAPERMWNEITTYQRLEGTGIAPEFLAIAVQGSEVVGLVLEALDGTHAPSADEKSLCAPLVHQLHGLGITHGDIWRDQFLLKGHRAWLIDYELPRDATKEGIERDLEDLEEFGSSPPDNGDEED
ncbi:Uu.00g043730.m01.CDS01 [Anthostomella pinea]|uniref:Uu.00g043730.m01.CDS01 n=1 Tax=Anthostomella pinea TaxID=933095 RepID=A0AAI8VBS6_9PEZI|nr:Uu.00g043730.m01.CDS01 [Anthostomella pinea]